MNHVSDSLTVPNSTILETAKYYTFTKQFWIYPCLPNRRSNVYNSVSILNNTYKIKNLLTLSRSAVECAESSKENEQLQTDWGQPWPCTQMSSADDSKPILRNIITVVFVKSCEQSSFLWQADWTLRWTQARTLRKPRVNWFSRVCKTFETFFFHLKSYTSPYNRVL